jgi:hypothetical protein
VSPIEKVLAVDYQSAEMRGNADEQDAGNQQDSGCPVSDSAPGIDLRRDHESNSASARQCPKPAMKSQQTG